MAIRAGATPIHNGEHKTGESVRIVDSILAGRLKELIMLKDVECNDSLRKEILEYKDTLLLQYTKELDSIKIIAVEPVTEKKLNERLSA